MKIEMMISQSGTISFHQMCTELENMSFVDRTYLIIFLNFIQFILHMWIKIKSKRCSASTWWCERLILLNQTHKEAGLWVAVLLCVFTLKCSWRWVCVWRRLVVSLRSWPKLQRATKAAEVIFSLLLSMLEYRWRTHAHSRVCWGLCQGDQK